VRLRSGRLCIGGFSHGLPNHGYRGGAQAGGKKQASRNILVRIIFWCHEEVNHTNEARRDDERLYSLRATSTGTFIERRILQI
jgi:hypothetical protein